ELLVPHQRESQRAPELLLAIDVGRETESVIRGKVLAAIIVMGAAVDLVGAGLGDHVEQPARRASELRRKSVGHHLKFLNRVEGNGEVLGFERPEELAKEIVGGIASVNHETGVVALL